MYRLILPAAVMATMYPAIAWARDSDALMATYRSKTQVVRPCDRSGDAIVICGTQAQRNAHERLPLPRDPTAGAPIRGDAPRASAAAARQGSCGVVGGQGMGCTGGLSVSRAVGALAKAVTAIIDPDADLTPPPSDRLKGAGQH
ncbi:MAG: hypothetical protein PSY12_15045 [bacterium]|nr:hypothetical protein [bacterium]